MSFHVWCPCSFPSQSDRLVSLNSIVTQKNNRSVAENMWCENMPDILYLAFVCESMDGEAPSVQKTFYRSSLSAMNVEIRSNLVLFLLSYWSDFQLLLVYQLNWSILAPHSKGINRVFSGTVIKYCSNWQACVHGGLIALLSEGYSKELQFS